MVYFRSFNDLISTNKTYEEFFNETQEIMNKGLIIMDIILVFLVLFACVTLICCLYTCLKGRKERKKVIEEDDSSDASTKNAGPNKTDPSATLPVADEIILIADSAENKKSMS